MASLPDYMTEVLHTALKTQLKADMGTALQQVDIAKHLYPPYHSSPTITNEEKEFARSKVVNNNQSSDNNNNKNSKMFLVLELFEAVFRIIINEEMKTTGSRSTSSDEKSSLSSSSRAHKNELQFATNPLQLVRWITCSFPLLWYSGAVIKSNRDYHLCLMNMIRMFCLVFKYQEQSKQALFRVMVSELHDMICDLFQVWMLIQQERSKHGSAANLPVIFIDLMPKTIKLLGSESLEIQKLRITSLNQVFRYLNATIDILFALSSSHSEIIPIVKGNALESSFLTIDFNLYETLILVIKMGHLTTKQVALRYLNELIRINRHFICPSDLMVSNILDVVSHELIELILFIDNEEIATNSWPIYRTQKFDDCFCLMIENLSSPQLCTDDSLRFVNSLSWNIAHSPSTKLCSLLVEMLYTRVLIEKNLITLRETHDLIIKICQRRLMTPDLLQFVLFDSIAVQSETTRNDDSPVEPSTKKFKPSTEFTLFGVDVEATKQDILPLFVAMEDIVLNANTEWRDCVVFLEVCLSFLTSHPYEKNVVNPDECKIMRRIVDIVCTENKDALLLNLDCVLSMINNYLKGISEPGRTDFLVTQWHKHLVGYFTNLITADQFEVETEESIRFYTAAANLIVACFKCDPSDNILVQSIQYFVGGALMHHNKKIKLIALELLPRVILANQKSQVSVDMSVVQEVRSIVRNISPATTDESSIQILVAVAKALGSISVHLKDLNKNVVHDFIDLCFRHLFVGKLGNKRTVRAFIQSLPELYRNTSSDIWPSFLSNLKAVVRLFTSVGDEDLRRMILESRIIEDLLRDDSGLFLVLVFPNNVAGFVASIQSEMKEALASDNKDQCIYLMNILSRIAISLSHNEVHIKKQCIFSISNALCLGDIKLQAYAVQYLEDIRHSLPKKEISTVLPIGDEIFDDWVLEILKQVDSGKRSDIKKRLNKIFGIVSRVLYDKSSREFLKSSLVRVVPKLVFQMRSIDIPQLELIVRQDSSSKPLWEDYFTHIMVYLSIHETEANYETYLGVYPDWKQSLLSDSTKILTDLSLRIHAESEERSATILSNAFNFVISRLAFDEHALKMQVFLPILETSAEWINNGATLSPLNAAICIKRIMTFMGPICNSFTSNLMSHLKSILGSIKNTESEEYNICLKAIADAWYTFLVQLNNEKLKRVFLQVVVYLLPLVELEKSMLNVFYLLIRDRKECLKNMFGSLPTLPKTDEFEPLNSIVNEDQPLVDLPQALRRDIKRAIGGIRSESVEVQRASLSDLKDTISQHHQIISQWIVSDESIPHNTKNPVPTTLDSLEMTTNVDLIRQLYFELMKLCSTTNKENVIDSLRCFGLLGAIDPSLLNLGPMFHEIEKEKDDINLAVTLIESLSKLLDGANKKEASFSIQELLKFCKSQSESHGSRHSDYNGFPWFNRLSMKEELIPLTNSSYFANQSRASRSDLPPKDQPFKQWVIIMARFLTSKATGNRKLIFDAIRPAFKFESFGRIVKYLLPYMMHNIFMSGNEADIKQVVDCITLILEKNQKQYQEHLQLIFSIVDQLRVWLSDVIVKSSSNSSEQVQEILFAAVNAERMINAIPNSAMAKAAFMTKSYARSLMYYENFMRGALEEYLSTKVEDSQDEDHIHSKYLPLLTAEKIKLIHDYSAEPGKSSPLPFLQRIYGHLDDLDSIKGVSALRTTSSLEEQIIDYETNFEWNEALMCYEVALQDDPNNIEYQLNMLRCNRNLGHLQTMLRSIDGALERLQTNHKELKTYAVQSAWRLAEWSLVEEYLKDANASDFEVNLAKGLIAYSKKDTQAFNASIFSMRALLAESFAPAASESYELVYPFLVQAQMTVELEQSYNLHTNNQTRQSELAEEWNQRLHLIVDSIQSRESLLSLRRVLYMINGMEKATGHSWLMYGNLARKNKNFTQAHNAMLQARQYSEHLPEYLLNYAKLLYAEGKVTNALTVLENAPHEFKNMDQRLLAKIELRAANWSEEIRTRRTDELQHQYEMVVSKQRQWEEGYFHLAKFLDSIFMTKTKADSIPETVYLTSIPSILENYGYTLQFGVKHIYHALPRFVKLFCIAGDCLPKDQLKEIGKVVQRFFKLLHPGIWANAISQFVSRMDHSNEVIQIQIRSIIAELYRAYPKHVLWFLASPMNVCKRSKARALVEEASKNATLRKILQNYEVYFQGLIDISGDINPNIKSMDISTIAGARQIRQVRGPTNVMVPILEWLTPEVPSSSVKSGDTAEETRQYTKDTTDISTLENQCLVMMSKAKPKKISFRGNDGRIYSFLAKQGDDLRRDSRFIEVSRLINKLFLRNPITRKRRLYIRTYAPVPLRSEKGSESGLVEWVENTEVLRSLIEKIEKDTAPAPHFFETKRRSDICKELHSLPSILKGSDGRSKTPSGLNKSIFFRQIVAKVPRLMHKWFLWRFKEPTRWLEARNSYVRTCAVMSMVGWVMGLGDRHSENILIDNTTGDLLHIDLNMIFEIGRKLAVSETVPFRCTTNIIDGMGVMGYEGVFRSTSEVTIQLLRDNREMIMNVLEAFVHDKDGETDSKIAAISAKLKGVEDQIFASLEDIAIHKKSAPKHDGQILSVQGNVDQLIRQATDQDRLAHMYAWWIPFL